MAEKKTSVLKGVTLKLKKMYPVKQTSDGTKYRDPIDLLGFTVRAVLAYNGEVIEGLVVGYSQTQEDEEPYLEIRQSGGEIRCVFLEHDRELTVLARPKGERNAFGPVPGPDDGYWDDDFVHEPMPEEGQMIRD